MTWFRADDRLHGHPKVQVALSAEPVSMALYVLAGSYSAAYELDGRVPAAFVGAQAIDEEVRQRAVQALLDSGLWERDGDNFLIHDYLNCNPSREELEDRRDADRARKRRDRTSAGNPSGVRAESNGHAVKDSGRSPGRAGKGSGRKDGGAGGRKVAGKPVTSAEMGLATAIVAAFNAAADSGYTVDAHFRPIVGRIREHPELDAAAHEQIIAAAFRNAWWDGRPGPEVVYGNAALFERCVEGARSPATRDPLAEMAARELD